MGKSFLQKLENSVVRQYGNSSAYTSSTREREDADDIHHTESGQSDRKYPSHRETINLPTNGRQRNGTQLYQSHKLNLRPVNRPSMTKKNNDDPSNTQNALPQKYTSKNEIHSPIKTQRGSDNYESLNQRNRSNGNPNDNRFQHLLQPTASSTNRISRQSQNIRNNTEGDDSQPIRTRSPRR